MRNSAVVVYVGPKVASNYTNWCLEEIGGTPIIVHLLKRLVKGLPLGDYDYIVAHHDDSIAEPLKKALGAVPEVQHFASKASGPLPLFSELLEKYPSLKTFLVFKDTTLWPDCRLTLEMAQQHRSQHAEGTVAPEYPTGLVPEIYETAAIRRMGEIGLPEDLKSNFIPLMTKANEIFEKGHPLRFKVLTLKASALAAGKPLHQLPSEMFIEDIRSLSAARHVLEKKGNVSSFDSTEACLFKEELIRFDAAGRMPLSINTSVSRPGVIPILFNTKFSGFSGAQECFGDLIINLDRSRFRPIVVLPGRGVFSEKLQAAGIEVETAMFDMNSPDPWKLRYFKQLIGDLKIKLVHIDGRPALPLVWAADGASVPYISHLREFVGRHAPDFLRFAARIITVSRAVAEDLQRSDIDPRKIIPIHDGQDLTLFNPEKFDRKSLRAAAGISHETKVIYMITRINPEKRLETLIQALPAVIQKFPGVLALFVGEASASNVSYFKAMQERVGALKLDKHVRFWGFEKNVASIHAFSDILVNARPDEPFGHSILEALAMGVPVVAPDRGGHTEILKHYENAVLFDAENPQALGAELIRLLADPKAAKKLADQGRLLVQTVSIPTHVARVTSVYDDVLNRA